MVKEVRFNREWVYQLQQKNHGPSLKMNELWPFKKIDLWGWGQNGGWGQNRGHILIGNG